MTQVRPQRPPPGHGDEVLPGTPRVTVQLRRVQGRAGDEDRGELSPAVMLYQRGGQVLAARTEVEVQAGDDNEEVGHAREERRLHEEERDNEVAGLLDRAACEVSDGQ